jgi:hypothetical protein
VFDLVTTFTGRTSFGAVQEHFHHQVVLFILIDLDGFATALAAPETPDVGVRPAFFAFLVQHISTTELREKDAAGQQEITQYD